MIFECRFSIMSEELKLTLHLETLGMVQYSLSSRCFPCVLLHVTGMGSEVGGASGKVSGRTANTNEFRGGKAISSKLYH